MSNKHQVIVGLSGGVDSAVTALLLKEQGFNVHGVFMLNWSEASSGCNWEWDYESAKRVAKHLDISLELWNFEKEYRKLIYEPAIKSFEQGETPNPDIFCNKYIKFGPFQKKALSSDAKWIATGHYARITSSKSKFSLRTGIDYTKDQSYFLATLNQDQLKHALFPLGELRKEDVRMIAQSAKLPNADRKDSYGICFVGEEEMKTFLKGRVSYTQGPIKTTDGKTIGKHDGLPFYTIGQRRGIQIGGGVPYYVCKKDIKNNVLFVAAGDDNPALFTDHAIINNVHWVSKPPNSQKKYKIRYRHLQSFREAAVEEGGESYNIIFDEPQRAVTPGQFLAIYDSDECLGGGIIIHDNE